MKSGARFSYAPPSRPFECYLISESQSQEAEVGSDPNTFLRQLGEGHSLLLDLRVSICELGVTALSVDLA